MLHCSKIRTSVDSHSITATIERALGAAGLDTSSGPLAKATATIRKALADAGLAKFDPDREAAVIDLPAASDAPTARRAPAVPSGRFTSRVHTGAHGSLNYKLYVPPSYGGSAVPLIVMLHGCTQDADDFAAGTRMNEWADQHGFLVAYPAQAKRANASQCWNWFDGAQQARGRGEPALIAGIVADIAATHKVDAAQVFVAGLSAGAAMAVIVADAYPEVFAAVAAHSGLPLGVAHDVPSAFAAMQGRPVSTRQPPVRSSRGVPTFVLHGDADTTVTPANGSTIVQHALQAFDRAATPLQVQHEFGAVCGGKQCTTTHYLDAAGVEQVVHCVVHGGSHVWFGGSAKGSYTDPGGPDASARIVEFFLARRA
jgi:poly(hydroxyalkanoate) depolymerase family esterase